MPLNKEKIMEKKILNQTVTLDTAPIHIAPGGSKIAAIEGAANAIASLLSSLREEIAYGLADIETIDANARKVRAKIYFGAADEGDFKTTANRLNGSLNIRIDDIAKDNAATGLSMQARNRVIDILNS